LLLDNLALKHMKMNGLENVNTIKITQTT